MKQQIIWSKFKLPFPDPKDDDDEEDGGWIALEEKKYNPMAKLDSLMNSNKNYPTPLGPINLEDHEEAEKSFNLWMAHTNFKITKAHVHLLTTIEGIEALQFISPYRFQVVIGYLFDTEIVKNAVEEMLCNDNKEKIEVISALCAQNNPTINRELRTNLEKTTGMIQEKYWAVYMLPNGEMNLIKSDNLDDIFLQKLADFSLCQSLIGGVVLTYNQK